MRNIARLARIEARVQAQTTAVRPLVQWLPSSPPSLKAWEDAQARFATGGHPARCRMFLPVKATSAEAWREACHRVWPFVPPVPEENVECMQDFYAD